MSLTEARGITADEIRGLLRKKYYSDTDSYNQTVVLDEVPDGTGWSQERWIDVAVFEMWKSKGLSRSAFEIKVNRADFLHELSNPDKHQWCKDCFHFFWFVAPKDVIQIEELPAGVGWMYPRGNKLCIARHAKRNDSPKLNDSLLAAFMRSAHKDIRSSRLAAAREFKETDTDYQRALRYVAAVSKFLATHGNRWFVGNTQQDIEEALNAATMDKVVKEERDHLLDIAGTFQRQILELLPLMLLIARKGILARDELGHFVVTQYGGHDNSSLEALKEMAKGDKLKSQRRYTEMLETLLAWDKLQETKL